MASSEIGILDTLHTHSHNGLPGILRMWRNWQTRRSQKPVMVTSWRFKSSHPHQREVRRVSSETRLFVSLNRLLTTLNKPPTHKWKNNCHGFSDAGVLVLRGPVPKGEY